MRLPLIDHGFRHAIHATATTAPQVIELFIPDRDRDRRPIPRIADWVTQAKVLLARINGGVTVTNKTGLWLNPDTEELIEEGVTHLESYIVYERFRTELCTALSRFLTAFARETNQAVLHVRLDGVIYEISTPTTQLESA